MLEPRYIAKGIHCSEETLLKQYPSGIPPFVDKVFLAGEVDATIADLQGQLKTAQAPRMYDCGSCAIGKGFEQRVAQLETELEEYRSIAEKVGATKAMSQLTTLQTDHARVLGLVQALGVPERYVVSVDDHGGQLRLPDGYILFEATSRTRTYALENLFDYVRAKAASLPAQPAQGPVKKCPVNCPYCNDPDYGHPGHK